MNIFYSDEDNRLNEEIIALMQKAAETAIEQEFGSQLEGAGYDVLALPVDLSVSIVNYDEIQELNSEYRSIDKITDVLSFPQFADEEDLLYDLTDLGACITEGGDDVPGTMLGDVVICYDRAIEQAEEYGTGIKRELIYLFVHSIFHLFGYDHMIDEEKAIMRAREEKVMEVVGL